MRVLEGTTVVSLEQAVSAPFASARLADAGSRVIKIERPEGDFARGYDRAARGQSSYFIWLNRGKESVALDLSRADDKARLEALIAQADVLIQNLKPGAMARLGLDIDMLRARHPGLIACSISGYGRAGPLANRKAYDLLVQAESGLCSVTGGAEAAARVGISVVDLATGASAHSAILEALIGRATSGRGCRIDLSMFDVIAEWLTVPLLNHEAGTPPLRAGLAHPSIAPYGVFHSRDGVPILIAVQSEREWRALCQSFLEDPAATQDPALASNVARVANRALCDARVASAFARQDAASAITALTEAGIALATVNDMAGLSAHPHLRRVTVQTERGPVALPAPAPLFDGAPRAFGPVPPLPDNTRPQG